MDINYMDYIFPSYSAPLLSSFGINLIIKGHTTLGIYNIHTYGIQARLIGLFFLFFSILLFYHLFNQIPNSIKKGKVRIILGNFLLSPFFIIWVCCILMKIFSSYFQYGTLLFILSLVLCFYFQFKFNKKLLEIYNKQ
jgi:hypothetical protein